VIGLAGCSSEGSSDEEAPVVGLAPREEVDVLNRNPTGRGTVTAMHRSFRVRKLAVGYGACAGSRRGAHCTTCLMLFSLVTERTESMSLLLAGDAVAILTLEVCLLMRLMTMRLGVQVRIAGVRS
jgi:hypothetical protein